MKFILSAAAGAVGVLVTLVFIPEITSLDLKEGDTRWDLMKKGNHIVTHSLCTSPILPWQSYMPPCRITHSYSDKD